MPPDTASGGPLALVRSGDRIRLSVKERRIDLLIDAAELHKRAANNIDAILRGAKPGDIPIYQVTKFDLSINLKTAKQLGLSVPPALLASADKVID